MLEIGPHRLSTPYALAPMAGVSARPYRLIVRELGASWTPTELISAEGLARRSAKTLAFLRHDRSRERPYCVQLFGGDPARMAEAAEVAAASGADVLDVNMGCPVPKVTRNGAGSALMMDPSRAGAIVSAIARATGLPVTAKIRSGWDASSLNAVEFARRLEDSGAVAIAVHGRTRAQAYSGRADWTVIRAVKAAVRVPVFGNGDVFSPEDGRRMLAETGCDGVMIGRGALGDPWIFRRMLGGPPPDARERVEVVLRHLREHVADFGDPAAGVRAFRKMLLWYARGMRGAAAFRVRALEIDRLADLEEHVASFFSTATADGGHEAPPDFGEALG